MGLRERPADLPDDARRVAWVQAAQAVEPAVERLAVQELHDDERPAVVGHAVVVDFDDVLAAQRRRCAGLVLEARAGLAAVGVLDIDELHGDARPERRVHSGPDGAHPAAPEQLGEPVLASNERHRCAGRVARSRFGHR